MRRSAFRSKGYITVLFHTLPFRDHCVRYDTALIVDCCHHQMLPILGLPFSSLATLSSLTEHVIPPPSDPEGFIPYLVISYHLIERSPIIRSSSLRSEAEMECFSARCLDSLIPFHCNASLHCRQIRAGSGRFNLSPSLCNLCVRSFSFIRLHTCVL